MRIKSWHLALAGLVFFCVYAISDIIDKNRRCNGNYEFGATDCHNEFAALSMALSFAWVIVLASPMVLLRVKKEAKRSLVAKEWIMTVLYLGLGPVLIPTLKSIMHLHLDDLADFLDSEITWLSWEILFVSPLLLAGLVIIFLFNRWRQALGAIMSILLGVGIIYLFFGNITYSPHLDLPIMAQIVLALSCMSYLFAGIYYFLFENRKAAGVSGSSTDKVKI